MRIYHELPKLLDFKCTVDGCDAAFAQELLLFEHSFSHTPGVFPFNCQDHSIEDCDYKTTKKDSFRAHLRVKHKIIFEEKIHGWKRNEQHEPEPIENPQVKINPRYAMRFEATQEVKVNMCRYCSKVYDCAAGLKYHEKIVHENLRYYCEAPGCFSVFTTRASWSDHQWNHRGGRLPFECAKFFPECDFKCRLQRCKFSMLITETSPNSHVEGIWAKVLIRPQKIASHSIFNNYLLVISHIFSVQTSPAEFPQYNVL
jgi:hypothetical protein